jgi:hypothetical protein
MSIIDLGKAFIYKAIREAIPQGYSAYRTLQTLRKMGVKIRTQTFYNMWKEVLQQQEVTQCLKKYEPEKPIPWWLHPKTSYNYPSKYGYVVEVTDYITGEKRNFGIYSNRTMSLQEIEEETREMALFYYGLTAYKVNLKYLWRT